MKRYFAQCASALGLMVLASGALAQNESAGSGASANVFYFGLGMPRIASALPFSIGYVRLGATDKWVWGGDYAGEGNMYDSTWGQTNSLTRGTSYNLLFGKNILVKDGYRVDAMALAGARLTAMYCASSNVGYQCYANQSPSYTYEVNYGAEVLWSFDKWSLGLRATNASAQALVGLRF